MFVQTIKDIKVSLLEENKEEPLSRESIILHCAMTSEPEASHSIGKKNRNLHKIKCFCGAFPHPE